MLTHLGDMAEVKGWALSVGRDKPFNQGPASLFVIYYAKRASIHNERRKIFYNILFVL